MVTRGIHNPYNRWLQTAEMVAKEENRTRCLVCALGPLDAAGGMPLLPLPLNRTRIQYTGSKFQWGPYWNHPYPLRVYRIPGWFCVNQTKNATLGHNITFTGRSSCKCTCNPTDTTECGGACTNLNLLAFSSMGDHMATQNKDPVYWICGTKAFHHLPNGWWGNCYPAFLLPPMWLLPTTLFPHRNHRSVDITNIASGSKQTWGKDEWPPERIIAHYDPASWNPGELVAGAREPMYNLNRIIRLQAVVEIVANATATALRLVATQLDETRTAVLQLRLGMDFILAKQGGFCAALNLTGGACCFNISDHGEAIRNLAASIEKVAHVPVQVWEGWNMSWLDKLLPNGWLRGMFFMLLGPILFLLLLCFCIPCLVQCLQNMVHKTMSRMMGPRVIALMREYQPIALDEPEGCPKEEEGMKEGTV
ncbi:syncytin-2-like [Podarcis raffonei]|nr:syncytin-2-like [Podarcis raffonei]